MVNIVKVSTVYFMHYLNILFSCLRIRFRGVGRGEKMKVEGEGEERQCLLSSVPFTISHPQSPTV
jgi:alpha/beta superfamily hydrolase